MSNIKHVWDPTTNEFIPARKPWEKIQAAGQRIQATPLVAKFVSVALVLRVIQGGTAAFWYDEGVSVVFARLPWPKMIAATAGDVHPPIYYILLWLLARTGIPLTEFTARIPSIIFSALAVYLTWILTEKFNLNRQGQIVVIAWVIISPLQLHYSQEARMYALLQAEVLTAIILLMDRKKALLSLVMAAILYTHNYGVFYLPALALAALITETTIDGFKSMPQLSGDRLIVWEWRINKFIKNWLIWFIIPVLAWIPWLVVLLGQMGKVAAGYWIQPVRIPSVVFVLYQMLFAYSMPPTFQGLGTLLTCGVLLYAAWRIYNDRPNHWQLLVILALGPLLLSVLLSLAWRPVLLFRGLIGSSIPLIILLVKAIEGISYHYKKYYAYGMIFTTLIAGLYGHYLYNVPNKGLTTTWVHNIESHFREGDVVLSLNDNGIIAAKTYAPDLPLFKLESCGEEPLGSLSPITREAIGVEERKITKLIPVGNAGGWEHLQVYTRVWFISTVAPVSPPCEIEAAEKIINLPGAKLITELANDEYNQAGVYLITSKDKY